MKNEYPLVKTRDYDPTRCYEVGDELYIAVGKFTNLSPGEDYKPIAVVTSIPSPEYPALALMIIGEQWSTGSWLRYKVLKTIGDQRAKNLQSKVVIVPYKDMHVIMDHCADVFEPSTTVGSPHAGHIFGLVVYTSSSASEIIVY